MHAPKEAKVQIPFWNILHVFLILNPHSASCLDVPQNLLYSTHTNTMVGLGLHHLLWYINKLICYLFSCNDLKLTTMGIEIEINVDAAAGVLFVCSWTAELAAGEAGLYISCWMLFLKASKRTEKSCTVAHAYVKVNFWTRVQPSLGRVFNLLLLSMRPSSIPSSLPNL